MHAKAPITVPLCNQYPRRVITMRIIGLLFVVVLFIPITSFAEENQFIERQYILGNHNPEPYDNLEEGCEWAAPYVPSAIVGGGTSELRVIMTKIQKV